jgi:hypothetical protein
VDSPTAALLLTVAVHIVAVAVLLWAIFDGERFEWRRWWTDDGDDGGGPSGAPDGPGGDALPLPDAEPAGLRIRTEHDRLGDTRRRLRRPEHAPEPARPREPAG